MLGQPRAADLIAKARALLDAEREVLEDKGLLGDPDLEAIGEHLETSALAELDDQTPEDEWWIDEERVTYVREHGDALRKL